MSAGVISSIVSDADVDRLKLWRICKLGYEQCKISLNIPKHTKLINTYQWRYCSSLYELLCEIGIDLDAAQPIITKAISIVRSKYGRKSSPIHELVDINLLYVACNELQREQNQLEQLFTSIHNQHQMLIEQSGCIDVFDFLMQTNMNGQRTMTKLYFNNSLSDQFIAIYRPTMAVINSDISCNDTSALPTISSLRQIRMQLLANAAFYNRASETLGKDLYTHV